MKIKFLSKRQKNKLTLTKRIIPCLRCENGRVVKGLHFESIKDAGDPVELATKYSKDGADEIGIFRYYCISRKKKNNKRTSL